MIGTAQTNDVFNINVNGLNFIGIEQFLTFEHTDVNTEFTVPENEFWVVFARSTQLRVFIPGISEQEGYLYYSNTYSNVDGIRYYNTNLAQDLVKGGSRLYFYDDSNPYDFNNQDEETPTRDNCYECIVTVIKYETTKYQNSLASSKIDPELNTPVLFPNPTSSLLALNSDKEYDIEVYDLLGNKLMALTGNSINMEHLSTATYIVKATDKSNSEELTYKVVKN